MNFFYFSVLILFLATWDFFISPFLRALGARFYFWLKHKRVCSWCQKKLGGSPVAWRTTHGMCEKCESKYMDEL